jgi:hypothetical protein
VVHAEDEVVEVAVMTHISVLIMAEIIAPRITVGLFMANSLGPLIRLLFKMIVTVPSSTPSQTLPTTANESDLVSIPRHEYAHQYLAQKRASFTSTATLAQSV